MQKSHYLSNSAKKKHSSLWPGTFDRVLCTPSNRLCWPIFFLYKIHSFILNDYWIFMHRVLWFQFQWEIDIAATLQIVRRNMTEVISSVDVYTFLLSIITHHVLLQIIMFEMLSTIAKDHFEQLYYFIISWCPAREYVMAQAEDHTSSSLGCWM